MKIAIVTFHDANNYGAVLQCHALAKTLNSLGHEVELADLPLHGKASNFRAGLRAKVLASAFSHFRVNFLPKVSKSDDGIDTYVFGSDQIWNVQITKEHYHLYFGAEVSPEIMKVAYAASYGLATWDFPEYTNNVKSYLGSFKAIGVRESTAVDICKDVFDVTSQKVVDPTLLLTDYSHLFTPRKKVGSLVCYIFGKTPEKMQQIRRLGTASSLKPILLSDLRVRKGIKSVPFPTVSKWLSYIEASEFVLTDSFHCMVFSILFKKNFIAIPAVPERAGRMKSLLNDLGLESRFFNSLEEALQSNVVSENIDFDKVAERIGTLREDSLVFLKKSLENN
ncbi:MAG: polysaccharide pyruvyl transferase family protein [Paraglaciecola sp.]|uniref:polysaccharide pyruvyl transferase family protein n=1 Tax=Paraglaciecola sp. TaxID=1920173 RepID=UPI0032973F0A